MLGNPGLNLKTKKKLILKPLQYNLIVIEIYFKKIPKPADKKVSGKIVNS